MAKKLDKVEVVVVGAGWSGGIAAAELTKEGYEVVSLEKGKDRKLEDFIGSKDELRYYIRGEMMEDLRSEERRVGKEGRDRSATQERNEKSGKETGEQRQR